MVGRKIEHFPIFLIDSIVENSIFSSWQSDNLRMTVTSIISSSAPPSEEMGEPEKMDEMEQVSSDLKSLKTLYGLLHRGPTDETVSFSKNQTEHVVLLSILILIFTISTRISIFLLNQLRPFTKYP